MARSKGKSNLNLGYIPRPWQAECHLNRKRFTVLACHRRSGKTILALMELIDKAVQFQQELGVFIYLAPLLKQAENVVWRKLQQILKPMVESGAVEVRQGDLEIHFKHNGAMIRLFGANNPDELRGMGIDGIVIDEVAQIDPEVWVDIVQPTLADRLGWALFIGTPKGINLFSELFFAAEEDEHWHAARYTVYDTDALDPDEVARIKNSPSMTTNSFAREFLCDFSASVEEQIISLADVEHAAGRQYRDQDIVGSPKILGVDPARSPQGDRASIVRRQGLVCFEPQVFHGINNMELASQVARVIDDWKPDAVFIDAGNGTGVIDRLRQLDYDVMEVWFGAKAIKTMLYVDRRTEMWFTMGDWIRSGGQIPNIRTFKQQLATPTWWNEGDKKRMESKKQIKQRLSGEAFLDESDGLALTFAEKVAPRDKTRELMEHLERGEGQRVRYDPFGADAKARRRITRR